MTSDSMCFCVMQACVASDCTFITCDIGRLMEREFVVLTLRSRLWEDSLRKLQLTDPGVSSRAIVQVQTLSQGIRPCSNQYASEMVSSFSPFIPSTANNIMSYNDESVVRRL